MFLHKTYFLTYFAIFWPKNIFLYFFLKLTFLAYLIQVWEITSINAKFLSKIPFQPYLKLQVHLETKWKDYIFSKCTCTHCSSPEGAEGTVVVCSLLG